jgi:outer membrane protein OmpA-like peptidoglycan-associated protein
MNRRALGGFLLAVLVGRADRVCAQKYRIDDPAPPDAKGLVLSMSGEVRTIQGLASQVAGRTEPLAAALSDLGATTTDTEIRIAMSADVLFDFDKADVKKEATPSLENVVTVLKSYPRSEVTIEGHTDAKGLEPYNQKLSERRATSVRQWLVVKGGLGSMHFVTNGHGAKKPVAPNVKPDGSDDPQGRAKNRRVEIVVRK